MQMPSNRRSLRAHPLNDYVRENGWVESYALYRTFSDQLGGLDLQSWPAEMRSPTPQEFKALIKRHQNSVDFYILLQYLCFLQLKAVKEYAHQRGVFLMGDLPILLSKDSVDVWQHPELFITHLQAGAPPDFYNKEGQNWGFPIFNWEAERTTQFSWWKQRLHYAGHFYALFRLDHVLGFFRILGDPPRTLKQRGIFRSTR